MSINPIEHNSRIEAQPSFSDNKTTSLPRPSTLPIDASSTMEGRSITPQKTDAQKYQDLTNHLSEAAFKKIDLLNDDKKIEQIVNNITRGDFKALDCSDPDLLYYGLKAVKEKKLSIEDFAMASFYWGIRKHHTENDIQVVSLFDDQGNVNKHAKEIIKQTMKISSDASKAAYGTDVIFTNKQIDIFFDQMRKAPTSQKLFFVVDDIENIKSLNMTVNLPYREPMPPDLLKGCQEHLGIITISQDIYTGPGINVFSRFNQENKDLRMIPSWDMAQTFLNTKFGNQAVQLYPTIDYASVDEMEQDGKTGRRIVSVPFHDIAYKTADNLPVHQDYDMVFHDMIYHGIMASFIPSSHQKAYVLIAKMVKSLIPKYASLQPLPQLLYERLLDMENPPYADPKIQEKFFKSFFTINHSLTNRFLATILQKYFSNDIENLRSNFKHNAPSAVKTVLDALITASSEANEPLCQFSQTSNFSSDLIKLILEHKEQLEQLGISFKDVRSVAQEYTNALEAQNILHPDIIKIVKETNFILQLDHALNSQNPPS